MDPLWYPYRVLAVVMTTPVQFFLQFLYAVHEVFITRPLRSLYFNGPLLHGYGFWGGTRPEDICAGISTGTSSLFWMANTTQCNALLDQRFGAFLTAVQVVGYAFVLYRFLCWFSFHFFVVNPTVNRIERFIGLLEMDTRRGKTKCSNKKRLLQSRAAAALVPCSRKHR